MPNPVTQLHQWVPANRVVPWPHCAICGIIRRQDKKNSKHCKGPSKVGPRKP